MVGSRRARAAAAALAAVLLASCDGNGDEGSDAAASPPPAPTPASPPPPSPTPSLRPTVTPLPANCGALVATSAVIQAVARPLPGAVRYLYAGPLPDSGRTGRVTCSYGVEPGPDGGEAAKVEISLIGYVDAATAAERIELTVRSAQGGGATVTPQPVGDLDGFVLAGPEGTVLVTADDDRTVVVDIATGVVPPEAAPVALDEVVTAVLAAQRPADGG